jgi:phosphate transport system substrate-binding protein
MNYPSLRVPICSALLLTCVAACDRTPPASEAVTPANSATLAAKTELAPAKQEAPVRASGSSALQPLVNAAKEKFETTHAGASIEVSAGGSKKGIADVASGAVQIGNSDIFAPDDLKAKLVDHKVAVVGFAAMGNKGPFNEKVSALTMEQLSKIFQGQIKNWSEVGGSNQTILVINRAPASGTRAVFGNIVLGGDKFVESQTEDNSGALVTKLKQSKGAISYLALSFKDPELVTFGIKVDGKLVEPSDENIKNGLYPIWSYEHMYTSGEATGLAQTFLAYMTSPEFQRSVLPQVKGFIPVIDMKVQRDHD